MFSPYYAWSRRRGPADPAHFCCLNVALYGRPRRWSMTERGRTALSRSQTHLAIGPSALHWHGDHLQIDIAEVTAPLPTRLRGTVRVHPAALTGRSFALDQAGHHHWSPLSPACRVEVDMASPSLRWSGPGYLDTNTGARPLEADFLHWDWCRAPMPGPHGDGAAILYNATRREGGEQSLALQIAPDGTVTPFDPPPRVTLPRTRWRVARDTRADGPVRIRQTLEDTPFYSRSVLDTHLLGQPLTAVHESLSLTRFTNPAIQAMLPFRIPRRF